MATHGGFGFELGQSVDDIALLTDEEVSVRIKQLSDGINASAHMGHDQKTLELEISWYLREQQLRESRKMNHETYMKRVDLLE